MAVTQVAHKQNYSWSLNPIFIWMRLIGVELNCSRSPSGRILLTVLGCVSLLFSVASFVYGFIFLYHNRRHISIETQSTNTFSLGLFISFTNFALRAISIHSDFFLRGRRNWPNIFAVLQQMELRVETNPKFHARIRLWSILSICYALLSVMFHVHISSFISMNQEFHFRTEFTCCC